MIHVFSGVHKYKSQIHVCINLYIQTIPICSIFVLKDGHCSGMTWQVPAAGFPGPQRCHGGSNRTTRNWDREPTISPDIQAIKQNIYLYLYVYIYIWYPPKKKLCFSWFCWYLRYFWWILGDERWPLIFVPNSAWVGVSKKNIYKYRMFHMYIFNQYVVHTKIGKKKQKKPTLCLESWGTSMWSVVFFFNFWDFWDFWHSLFFFFLGF